MKNKCIAIIQKQITMKITNTNTITMTSLTKLRRKSEKTPVELFW